jgi:ethanolamine ammonia-lyase small subunit
MIISEDKIRQIVQAGFCELVDSAESDTSSSKANCFWKETAGNKTKSIPAAVVLDSAVENEPLPNDTDSCSCGKRDVLVPEPKSKKALEAFLETTPARIGIWREETGL